MSLGFLLKAEIISHGLDHNRFEVVRKGLALAASNFNINTIVGKGISCPGCKTSALIPEPGRFWDNNNIFYTVNTECNQIQDLSQSKGLTRLTQFTQC